MTNNDIFQNKGIRRMALFYIFANLFNVHLNRRLLDSRTCFYIQSAVTVHVT